MPDAAFGRNQTVLLEGRAPSRPLALGRPPRRSVALQITRKHARKSRTSSAMRDHCTACHRRPPAATTNQNSHHYQSEQ